MITKLELIEYLKHTPENTNYNILRSGLYNGSNKEIVDEFIEALSRGNLSLAALQPYLAKLYEDDKTISPDPLPPFSSGGSSVPKPLTYDYMPEGYPSKSEKTTSIEVDITWDGDTSGLVASSQNHMYRVSDTVYTLEQFKKMNYVSYGEDTSVSSAIEQGGLTPENIANGLITVWAGDSQPVIVTKEAVANGSMLVGGAPDTFTKPGVYFPADGSATRLYSPEPIVETVTTIVPMSSQFMPSDYPNEVRVTEMINAALGVIENGSY